MNLDEGVWCIVHHRSTPWVLNSLYYPSDLVIVDIQAFHDLLIEVKPETAVHDSASCEYCQSKAAATASQSVPNDTGGGVLDVSITQEDLDNAVKAAVAPLQQELEQLRKFKSDVESTDAAKALQEQIDAAKTEVEALQQKLDAANIEVTEAKNQHDELVAWLTAEAEKAEQEAAVAALREERAEKVRELEIFDDEYIEENAERFAKMDEDTFVASMADWKTAKAAAQAAKEKVAEIDPSKTKTAFVATRDDDGKPKSHLSDLMRLRNQGVDVRRIRS